MNQTLNDGGPAFPTRDVYLPCGQIQFASNGMTLREYFAVGASEEDIQEYLPKTLGEVSEFKLKHGFMPTRGWARYQHEDAMLKAGETKP